MRSGRLMYRRSPPSTADGCETLCGGPPGSTSGRVIDTACCRSVSYDVGSSRKRGGSERIGLMMSSRSKFVTSEKSTFVQAILE
jgi:hypothetical protein